VNDIVEFLTELDLRDLSTPKKELYELLAPLVLNHKGILITVPKGFKTDLASVPRVPFIYNKWGNRAHREAVIHDYLYKIDAIPNLPREMCDLIFLDAMICRGNDQDVYEPMYEAVRAAGWIFYKKCTMDEVC